MSVVLVYIGLLILGYILSSKLKKLSFIFSKLSPFVMIFVYVLVLIMGMKMGVNEQVTSNLSTIGLKALIITIFCIAGSMLSVFALRKFFGINKYAEYTAKQTIKKSAINHNMDINSDFSRQDFVNKSSLNDNQILNIDLDTSSSYNSSETHSSSNDTSNLKSTLIILVFVALGMLIGHFYIAANYYSYIDAFQTFTGNLMVILLATLLFLIGLELGLTINIFDNIKGAGFRILAFPIATILGTLAFGSISAIILGFSLKEGLAISSGFGWYTYAPTVIADAGPQYIVASAVSFMHNVIRETSGIVLIPFMAKKFGYIEATTIPGVCAMDVCLPIVENSCNGNTVVYSFVIGISLNLGTAVMVPFFMNM